MYESIEQQQKLTKAALNCVTNIYNRKGNSPHGQTTVSTQPSAPLQPAIKENAEMTFKKLKDVFINLVKSLQFTYKSKRAIIMLTTVIRALQYVMEVAISTKKSADGETARPSMTARNTMMKLDDSDAIILFINFYKLIFLGTKFTEKVL